MKLLFTVPKQVAQKWIFLSNHTRLPLHNEMMSVSSNKFIFITYKQDEDEYYLCEKQVPTRQQLEKLLDPIPA